MRLMRTQSVPDGAELARDIMIGRADGMPLLRAGAKITAGYRNRLLDAGIHAVYVEDAQSAGIVIDPIISDDTRQVATRAVASAHQAVSEAWTSGTPLESETVDALSDVVERILVEILAAGDAALALADLSSADAYTFQHSIDVTALGLLLGERVFRDCGWVDYMGERQYTQIDQRLSLLGLGLLLHDIGKLAIPVEIVRKPGKLTTEEWELMQTHPRAGVDLLADTNCPPVAKSIVLRHHERWDGSGYPDGKNGSAIHQMARIAAVADVYDAITSERSYARARPPHEGVRAIADGAGTLFDPDVATAFARLVPPFPPGDEIRLTDGRHGIVVSVPEKELDRPVVRVIDGPDAPYEIALVREPTVRIAEWDPEPPHEELLADAPVQTAD
jgi:HD-GYP domain-containing protein (c-di-GMP phosphodiesterase class II)